MGFDLKFRPQKPYGVLFVCMGNICRSPTAEGVFRAKAEAAGIADRLVIDSAGTHNDHPKSPPDERTQAHAAKRGYDLSGLRARQIQAQDFANFDLICVMDWQNLELTEAEYESACAEIPNLLKPQIRRFTEFCIQSEASTVPDPYYGGPRGFELVLDLVEDASNGLIARLKGTGAK